VRERKTTHGKADDGNDNENGSEYCCGLHRLVTSWRAQVSSR
jgi:hypothetical protein